MLTAHELSEDPHDLIAPLPAARHPELSVSEYFDQKKII